MKKLDKLILKSYLGPLALTFSISMFVLLLEFLWRKIESLIGKGLEIATLAELFAYAAASIVPMALPLSILLASIMTMGNFGEKYELVAMKSAGISLWRIYRPLIILSLVLSVTAFYFSSYVIPNAELKVKQIIGDIKDKKPALNIRPNEFYNEISSYVIRINAKDNNTGKMYGIIIYNHSKDIGNVEVIKADSGYMYSAENNLTMVFKLYNGEVFTENITNGNYHNRPLTRIHFNQQTMRFDVSDFAMQKSDDDKYSDSYKTMNISQLYRRIDSLQHAQNDQLSGYEKHLAKKLTIMCDGTTAQQQVSDFYKDFSELDVQQRKQVERVAGDMIQSLNEEYSSNILMREYDRQYLSRNKIEFYRKFTLSLACIILFFIGAPLGAIIRKGGLGMPVVVSIIAFVIYYAIGMLGESAAKVGSLSPLVAMWLSSIIFFPLGLFFTLKATSDSKIFSLENWEKIFSKLFISLKLRKNRIDQ
ncbi:MAG: LptF/LptG family permease [Bacteroidales bacterium]|nr:LptF/LptG family permease [Bacteroidales bacterium]